MDIKTVKKRLKSVIGKSIPLKALIISVLAFVISYGLYYVLRENLVYIGVDSSNLSYLQEYYKNRNQSDTVFYDNEKVKEKILIIPIDESISNDSISNLIDTLCLYKATVIGIDYIFQNSSNSNDSCYKNLKDKIHQHSDKIVLAQAYDDNCQILDNIFVDDYFLSFGLINSYGYDSIPFKRTINNIEYDYFAYKVAKKYNRKLFENNEDSVNLVTNYSNINLQYIDVPNLQKLTRKAKNSLINQKIILIGPFDDIEDIHSTPFIIEGKEMISGIKLHAYTVYSLISPNYVLKRLSIASLFNMLVLGLLFLYSLLYVFLTDKKNKWVEKYNNALGFIRPILLLIFVSILLLACYYLTMNHTIIPNVIPFLISVFLINTFNDFLANNINSNKYEE